MTLTQLASVPDRQPIARRATAGELEQLTPRICGCCRTRQTCLPPTSPGTRC